MMKKLALVFLHILLRRQAELLEVAHATGSPRTFTGFGEGGKQNRRQNRNDGDDDEQLDQCKTAFEMRRAKTKRGERQHEAASFSGEIDVCLTAGSA